MLSKTQVVMFKKAIQRMYDCTATITASVETVADNGVVSFDDTVIYENIPCKVQEDAVKVNNDTNVSMLAKVITMYCEDIYNIPIGCRIDVCQQDKIISYKNSGIPALFDGFQKLQLEYVDKYA